MASALLRRSPELFRGAFRCGLNHGVGSLFTKVLNLSYKRSLSKFESDIEFTSVRRFGDETDALWDRIERNFPIAVVRDAEYLNWKYVDQPDIEHNCMLVKHQGTLIGILILREPDISGNSVISEIIMDPNDSDLAAVIAHVAVKTLAASGASRVTAATSIPTFISALERVGFKRRGEVVGMFGCDGSVDNPSLAYEKNAWLLSRADHDWDAGGQMLSDAYS